MINQSIIAVIIIIVIYKGLEYLIEWLKSKEIKKIDNIFKIYNKYLKYIWMISYVVIITILVLGLLSPRMKILMYNTKSEYDVPIKKELINSNKIEEVAKGDLSIEDMWYIMITDVKHSSLVENDDDFFVFEDMRSMTNIDNFFIVYNEEYNFGCHLLDNQIICYDRTKEFDQRINITMTNDDYEIYKNNKSEITNDEVDKMKKFHEDFVKETNIYFQKYYKIWCLYKNTCTYNDLDT